MGLRAQMDFDEIVDINGRLQSPRDAITETRTMYKAGVGARKPTFTGSTTFWFAGMTIWRSRYRPRSLLSRQLSVNSGTPRRCCLLSRLDSCQIAHEFARLNPRLAGLSETPASPLTTMFSHRQTGGSVRMLSHRRSLKHAPPDAKFWISPSPILRKRVSGLILKSHAAGRS